jgi:hypothetical protein
MRWFFLILFLPLGLVAQQPPHKEYRDINGDGHKDSLTVFWDGGSGFGSASVTVENGKTLERLEWTTDYCFCAITSLQLVPEIWLRPGNEAFRKAAEPQLFSPPRSTADPSLKFILEGLNSFVNCDTGDTYAGGFNYSIQPQPGKFGESAVPAGYSILLQGDSVCNLIEMGYVNDGECAPEGNPQVGWLTYGAGSTHFDQLLGKIYPKVILQQGSRSLLATHHGVVLQEGGHWQWIWVTDHHLTGSPDKLRWGSILNALYWDADHVVIEYLVGQSGRLAVVNTAKGEVTLFQYDYGCQQCDYTLEGSQLKGVNEYYPRENKTLEVEAMLNAAEIWHSTH